MTVINFQAGQEYNIACLKVVTYMADIRYMCIGGTLKPCRELS